MRFLLSTVCTPSDAWLIFYGHFSTNRSVLPHTTLLCERFIIACLVLLKIGKLSSKKLHLSYLFRNYNYIVIKCDV